MAGSVDKCLPWKKGITKMRLLCVIGGGALGSLFIFFLVIDIAAVRVGRIMEEMEGDKDASDIFVDV